MSRQTQKERDRRITEEMIQRARQPQRQGAASRMVADHWREQE